MNTVTEAAKVLVSKARVMSEQYLELLGINNELMETNRGLMETNSELLETNKALLARMRKLEEGMKHLRATYEPPW